MKSQRLYQDPSHQRRLLLRLLTLGTWGALGSLTLVPHWRIGAPTAGALLTQAAPRERPIREADFYRPHDLAG
ncbi:MAG: hypothetical protein WAT23_17830 [Chromatiaceae bacterium]